MRYEKPTTVEAATALLAGQGARVLAGGTDLLVQMRSRVLSPDVLVDIKGIDATRKITKDASGYTIGAAVTGAELKEHPTLSKDWPGLVEAANLIGSTQVQGRCSLGGNLCNGSPAADSVPGMIAAGAVATIAGPKGTRTLPVEDIMLAPRKLALTAGEFIVSFKIPARPAHGGDAYLRFIPRDPGAAGARGRCLPALHPPHGDGHRCGRMRRRAGARCRRDVHCGARGARRRGGAAAAGRGWSEGPDRHQGR